MRTRVWICCAIWSLIRFAAAAEDDNLPVAEAAKRVGETVTFYAEAVAVAHSPRTETTYVNFGDAYPRQTLSLRFDKDDSWILDALPGVRGRTLRVSGVVEATSRGPIIRITASGQIQIVRRPAGDVLEAEGEGPVFRTRVGDALRQLRDAEDFETLEKFATSWRNSKARNLDGRWRLLDFYEGIRPSKSALPADEEAEFQRIGRWMQAFPVSITPHIALAGAYTRAAWNARGRGFAPTVDAQGWEDFARYVEKAKAVLESVRERRAECPQSFLAMLGVAADQGWSRENYEQLFAGATSAHPEYDEYYVQKMGFLLPRWYGRPGEWEAFTDETRQRFPGGRGDELYTRICMAAATYYDHFFQEAAIPWDKMKRGFEALRAHHPSSVWLLNNYAWYAVKADDYMAARTLMAEIGDRFDMKRWTTWTNVDKAKTWAARGGVE